jgi:YfiH family protein
MVQLHNKKAKVPQTSGRSVRVSAIILTMQDLPPHWIQPDWPAPKGVRAIMTSRHGGVSLSAWASLNLGDHVGDRPEHVQANRAVLTQWMGCQPVFLRQVHGVQALRLSPSTPDGSPADACWTDRSERACTIMVADCLPVLLCDRAGRWVAAAHAGWRGLAGQNGLGVLESLLADVRQSGADVSDVLAWLGPCIGTEAFEVGDEVRAAFDDGSTAVRALFKPLGGGQWLADLAGLARWRLQAMGVLHCYGNDSSAAWCTASHPGLFFSHRRDSRSLGHSGRMAAAIWLDR